MPAKSIFRQESVDRLSSPQELDRLFTVVGPRAWIPLLTLLVLCGLAVTWCFVGAIPETEDGAGVLINPGNVRGLQCSFGGQLIELRVRPGQAVRKGDTIAVVNQPELRQQLIQAKARLRELDKQDEIQSKLEGERKVQDSNLREAQEKLLQEAIKEVTDLAERIGERNEDLTKLQRDKLAQIQKDSKVLNAALKERLSTLRELGAKKIVTSDAVMGAESTFVENNLQLANLEMKMAELDIKDVENKQYFSQQRSKIADLRIQLKQLDVKATQLELDMTQSRASRASIRMEQDDRVKQLETYLEEQGTIHSLFTGRVLELSVQPGQILQAGARIGAIELADDDGTPGGSSRHLKVLSYFPLKSGKKIREGMEARITPTSVQRERHGSIIGKVTRVSGFPITAEAAATAVGHPEIVQALLQPGGMIEVEIELERDDGTVSGFRWTSAGPPLQFAAGTPAAVRVTVEERAPITYVFPIMHSWSSGG
jgi:HlyD family secretion protein